jgi:hypothetical protein
VLRGSQHNGSVRLIVARPIEPTSPDYQMISSTAPIIPTKMLTGDPDELDKTLQSAGYAASAAAVAAASSSHQPITTTYMTVAGEPVDDHDCDMQQAPMTTHIEVVAAVSNHQPQESSTPCGGNSNRNSVLISPGSVNLSQSQLALLDTPETETYEVELRKNVYGLGITVAGYVCEEEDLSGIFVKSIIEGSAAELSQQIQINDRIIAVDGRSLAGSSNYQAVEILRNTDIAVKLTLERFLRGRRYEHLQVALVDGTTRDNTDRNSQKSLQPSPSVTTLSICMARSDADSIVTECGECDMEECSSGDSNSVVENGNELDEGACDNENGVSDVSNESGEETPVKSPSLDSMAREWQVEINNDYRIVVSVFGRKISIKFR